MSPAKASTPAHIDGVEQFSIRQPMMVGAGQREFNADEPGNDLSALSRPLMSRNGKRARQVGSKVSRACYILAHLSRPYE